MTPKCCERCSRYKDGVCATNCKLCGSWLRWFNREWNGIREAAQSVKKQKEEPKE